MSLEFYACCVRCQIAILNEDSWIVYNIFCLKSIKLYIIQVLGFHLQVAVHRKISRHGRNQNSQQDDDNKNNDQIRHTNDGLQLGVFFVEIGKDQKDDAVCKNTRNDTDENVVADKRLADKTSVSTDKLHRIDNKSLGINTQPNGVSDQRKGNKH